MDRRVLGALTLVRKGAPGIGARPLDLVANHLSISVRRAMPSRFAARVWLPLVFASASRIR